MYKSAIAAILVASAMVVATPSHAEAATLKSKALSVAKAQKGDRYQYGATGPNAFDCSGLTYYSYKKSGKTIKRVANDQYNASKHISASAAQPGDLVFFKYKSGGKVFHMGIVSKKGYMVHANAGGYYGKKVIEEKIAPYWGKNYRVYYGSVK
ncbi:hydrolase [Streptomyces phage Samisti12]|uniref:Hydrolase n=5 Tax=Samistivirus TaxID=2560220 RepID=A0A223G050_9CAUD|nr:hydrolase [Streptomyces phage Peebs]YP_009611585.1 hydrolase [Streptomyces phage Samisti12]ASR76575.1 hydrolase [Streptomyces phage Sushi23]QAX95879.1 hydrolase [Streptomyces phage Teutsch]QGH78335.1 hydrolase [Streptomyces phage Tribute]WDS51942.1 hydrolase [Streptomyces phage Pepperwood]ASR77848.1 hydrolase [Streptomyces phage Peebs]